MVDLHAFNRPLSSKSRPQMIPPVTVAASSTENGKVTAPSANVGGTNATTTVRRFWPSYIDQHVAQLDFDASVMMMTSAGDECHANDDDEEEEEDDDDADENGGGGDDDDHRAHHRQRPQRQNGSRMARPNCGNIFDSSSSNNSSMTMAMMMLDAGVAAAAGAAADSAQLISTDSLDMEQLRVRCECTKHNANYKLTFDEDSGQWTTSGIGGSFTTTATASPPMATAAAAAQHQQKQRRGLKQQQKQQLQQAMALTNQNNNNNNDGRADQQDGADDDGHGDECRQQLYTAIMDNNGALGLRLLEQLNNADDDEDDTFGLFNTATQSGRGGGGTVRLRPGTIGRGHGMAKNAVIMDALLNNQNNNVNNSRTTTPSSSSSHCNFRADGGAKTKGLGTEMMTTWGRLHQGHMADQQTPFNSEKVHSLPELNSKQKQQQQSQRGATSIGANDLSSIGTATTATTTKTTTFAKGVSTPAMATHQHQHHAQAVQAAGGSVSSSSASSAGLRRPTSSLLDNFIAGQRQHQRNGCEYEYSETYLGNGRYIDMNENEIGYVPSCTASVQRSGNDDGSVDDGAGDPQQLALFDLDLRRRQLLGESGGDDNGGLPVVHQQRHRMAAEQPMVNYGMTPMKMANATTAAAPGDESDGLGDGTTQMKHSANGQQQQQQSRQNLCHAAHQLGTVPTTAVPMTPCGRANNSSGTPAATMHQQRRTFADLSASRTVPDLKFIALSHNVPSICPPSSMSLDNLLCRVRNSGADAAGANAAAIDELIDCCASSMRIISEVDGGVSDAPDSGLGSSHSDGPSHIEDWASLSVLLPRNVLEACSFFKTNSFLLTGSSNNIEGRRPAVPPPPRSFTSGAIWRLKEKANCCLGHPLPSACVRCGGGGGANTDPSTPTTAAASDAAPCTCSSCCCCYVGGVGGATTDLAHAHCTKSAVFSRQQLSSRSRAMLSQKLRLHARELTLIGLPIYDQKRAIIERVVEGVAEVIRGASSVVLMKALERLLGDELLPGVRMWHVICTVTGPGPVTRNVYQLIQQLEASEKPDHSRVSHFFRGLLSLHSLDGWLSYVVLKEHVLRPFYASSAFLIGAQTAYRSLYWRLIECVELLSVLNQCGEAGKRWERRQKLQQQQRMPTGADTGGSATAKTDNASPTTDDQYGRSSPTVVAAAWYGGAARLPKDSRVPKSSSVPTKLLIAAATTTPFQANCIEEEEQEVEAVQQDEAEEQLQQNGIKLGDVQLVEVQCHRSMEKEGAQMEDNNNNNNHNTIRPKEADAFVHPVLRPSRIPILRTWSRSSTLQHSSDSSSTNGPPPRLKNSPTFSRRSSSARPTPPCASNSPPPIYICPVREAIAGDHAEQPQQQRQSPSSHASGGGTLLYPLRKGEHVRVLSVRGEYTRCSRLPADNEKHRRPPTQHRRQLALQNGLVPTRTLQFGASDDNDEQQRHEDDVGKQQSAALCPSRRNDIGRATERCDH